MVRAEDMSTYCVGPMFFITKDVTRADIIAMCDELSEGMRDLHHGVDVHVIPERIGEGGFLIQHPRWRTDTTTTESESIAPKGFKTMRVGVGPTPGQIADGYWQIGRAHV